MDPMAWDATTVANVLIAFFTAVLVITAIKQNRGLRRANDIAADGAAAAKVAADASKRSLEITQRAVVGTTDFADLKIIRNGKVEGFVFEAWWVNSGPTAAVHAEAGTTFEIAPTQTVETVLFSNKDFMSKTNNMSIPQSGTGRISSSTFVGISDLIKVFNRAGRLFLLARIEYSDLFGCNHHTQVCSEVRIFGNPTDPAITPNTVRYVVWREHNSSD